MLFRKLYLRFILLFILSFYFFSTSFSQERAESFVTKTKIAYEFTYLRDSTNREKIDHQEMHLLVNDSVSLFASSRLLKNNLEYFQDLAAGKTSFQGQFLVGLINVNVNTYYIIKDQQGSVTTIDNILGMSLRTNSEFVEIKEDKNVFDWSIAPDIRKVSGFECQKAETYYGGRKWVAWFATEIPISDGPYKFCGLPGLIIEIYDDQAFYNFKLDRIESFESTVPLNFRSDITFREMTSEDFFKERKRYQNNIYENTMSLEGAQKFSSEQKEEMRNRAQDILMQNNNWIELYP